MQNTLSAYLTLFDPIKLQTIKIHAYRYYVNCLSLNHWGHPYRKKKYYSNPNRSASSEAMALGHWPITRFTKNKLS